MNVIIIYFETYAVCRAIVVDEGDGGDQGTHVNHLPIAPPEYGLCNNHFGYVHNFDAD